MVTTSYKMRDMTIVILRTRVVHTPSWESLWWQRLSCSIPARRLESRFHRHAMVPALADGTEETF